MKKSVGWLRNHWSVYFVCLGFCISLITGCGKHETGGSVMGTATGAIIGASLSGNKGTGALVGGLLGNLVGGSIGRSEDEEEREIQEERDARIQARQQAETNYRISRVEEENRTLKQQMVKWCVDCNREITLLGANSCPSCGGDLIHEKFCTRCSALFSPKSGFKYCPYCKNGSSLGSR